MRALDTALNAARSHAARWIVRRRSPALLRWMAGRPAALRSTRRGSVLVLVLGALAMLAVVTLIYATVGQETRRTGDVVQRRADVQRTVDDVAEYIGRVVAEDVFSTFVQRTIDPTTTPRVVQLNREAFDFGFTDPAARSDARLVEDFPDQYQLFNPVGTFYEGLQSGVREFRLASDPWLAATEPTWLDASGIDHAQYRDNALDWAHITNIAPDGRFVNLINLRNNFDAPPGIDAGEMSDKLTRIDADGSIIFNPTSDELVTPYLWDSRQYYAFAPAISGRFVEPNGGADILPTDDHYPPYQWADADGDGLFDSRWFELVDASDPDNIVSLLPKDDRYRWFVAARIIDLSGLVNVNTATDFRDFRHVDFLSPDQTSPVQLDAPFLLGLFPSDIDLRRLLTLEDSITLYGEGEAYDALQAAVPPGGPDDYSGYDGSALDIANPGYEELRDSLDPFYALHADINLPWLANPHYRATYYTDIASQPQGAGAVVDTTNSTTPFVLSTGSLFGLADELELRTYRLANDSRSTSRLEFTLDGRFSGHPGGPLRSNRDLLTERDKVDRGTGDGPPDGEIDPDGLALSAVDIRQRLTTLSGARPLLSGPLPYDTNAAISSPDGLAGWLTRLKPGYDNRTSATEALRLAFRRSSVDATEALFFSYAAALLPYSDQPGAWDPTTQAGKQWATAHYGTDPSLGLPERMTPELALRTAAHLLANTVDFYDRDTATGAVVEYHEPSAFTLITSQAGREAVSGGTLTLRTPWWWNGGKLRLDDDQLATAADPPTTADVVNVFGIEPQPFLIEAATLSLYTDAVTGDDEVDTGTGDASINGIIPDDGTPNPDFLGQFFAFQLTNPFDVEIALTGKGLVAGSPVPDGYSDYYVEFGGNIYKLAEIDPVTGELKPVTLQPRGQEGSTKVFVAFNQTADEAAGLYSPIEILAQRFTDADPTITLQDAVTKVGDMVRHQFLVANQGLGTSVEPIFIPRMKPLDGTLDHDFADIFGTTVEENKAALLWRTLRRPNQTGVNQRINDMLADRLGQADPAAPTAHLDRQLRPGNDTVEGLDADETPSIGLWASIRRSDNPTSGMPVEDHGFIPAYCLEPRWPSGALANHESSDTVADTNDLKATDFDDTEPHTNTAGLQAFIDQLTNDDLVSTIRQFPADKTGAAITANQQTGAEFSQVLTQLAMSNNDFVIDPDGSIANSGANSGDELPTIRVGDLLLPLGIGPAQEISPGPTPAPNTNSRPNSDEFMTLSESLAVALGYSSPDPNDPTHTRFRLYADWKYTDTRNALDRGNLRLDRYTPFFDADQNGIFDPTVDDRLAPGIPLALNILNIFAPYDSHLGGMTRATPGLININTAPVAVLRTLPLLNPPSIDWPPVGLVPQQGSGIYAVTTWANDLAATLAAYRDKALRPVIDGSAPVNFSDTTTTPEDPDTWDGRWTTLRLGNLGPEYRPAIREQPGFASVGEVLATTDVLANPTRLPDLHRIDRLGSDNQISGAPGLSPAVYDHDGIDVTLPVPDAVTDDYAEKLLIAAGISNLITVRSDYYAVWFVLHGYQRTDTEGLTEDDPLVPSVAKRFVMVLDRSAVTEKGQKPRVVLLEEVPM